MTYNEESRKKMRATMLRIYGSEEAVKEEYRRRQAKSRKSYKGTGGFAYLKKNNPDKLKKISIKGGKTPKRGEGDETN